IDFRLGTHRMLVLELAFIAVLGLLHLGAGDTEFRAIARAGQGGGVIGGALASFFARFLGNGLTALIFIGMLGVAAAIALGVGRQQVTGALRTASKVLRRFDDRADLMYRYALNQRRVKAIVGVGRSPSSSLMRIRPDPAHIRPS